MNNIDDLTESFKEVKKNYEEGYLSLEEAREEFDTLFDSTRIFINEMGVIVVAVEEALKIFELGRVVIEVLKVLKVEDRWKHLK